MRQSLCVVFALQAVLWVAGCNQSAPPAVAPPADSQTAPASSPATVAAEPASAPQAQTVDAFWKDFRNAVLSDNRSALQSKIRFPFMTLGPGEGDPQTPYEQAQFWELYPKILAQDAGTRLEPETVRQYIERNENVPPIALGGGKTEPVAADAKELRAGPLNFEKIDDRWYWVSAVENFE